ncbi:hypothetical protein Poli38472_009949 [Pythium oligandrum]|uniref:Uncharacterized protein n=1 Tax=Pythium oligandrum TaxID=41045 RepID=A0A8K1C8G3_PYTOL|nr:hypothetical protein Poli38472_009949 [Pythium oligandrum]|eukprot:TMW58390.1 hypothetical protein Poli38472_009949 [Pythium oligandrum]
MKTLTALTLCVAALGRFEPAVAHDFPKLDAALPLNVDISAISPVMDTDKDSCLPSAAISRTGEQNGGLKPTGKMIGGCYNADFMNLSNSYHRYACLMSGPTRYCGHFFAYYFQKDQLFDYIESGHRHDFEHVAVWTTNGTVTHGTYSTHGDMVTKAASEIPNQDGHLKFVYHKDGVQTRCFRFAKTNEAAENPQKTFVLPTVVSWYTMKGDGIDNADLRSKFNGYDFGSAHNPIKDGDFLPNLNEGKPTSYPVFTQASVDGSQ